MRRDGTVYAALDLGTNNCRMLVARPMGASFKVIDAFSRATRLGEGLAASGRLSDAAMDRTIIALGRCLEKIHRHRVSRARFITTEACRRAENGDDFLERVAMATGIDLEIITAREEAELAVAGCAALIDSRAPYALVFDIGGGSTELIWVKRAPNGELTLVDYVSLPVGVVTLGEGRQDDLKSLAGYRSIVAEIQDKIAAFISANGIAEKTQAGLVQVVGTSGTVTTLGGVMLNLPRYDRMAVDGMVMNFDDIAYLSNKLAGSDLAGRQAYPCIGKERADLVVGGCAILAAICESAPARTLTVADRGLREGILHGMIRADAPVAAE